MSSPQIIAPVLIDAGSVITNWAAASGCAVSLATAPARADASTPTAIKALGSAANTTMFFNCTGFTSTTSKPGLEFEIDVDWPGAANLGNNGLPLTVKLINAGATITLAANVQLQKGWQKVRLAFADFDAPVNTPLWDSTTWVGVQFRVQGYAGWTGLVYVRNLKWSGYNRPYATIMFDDGYSSVYTDAFPYMAARGIVGTCAIISSKIDTAGYMTLAQLQELKAAGWHFVNHTVNHKQNVLNAASQAACFAEIDPCSIYLEQNGLSVRNSARIFCAPYGEYSAAYLAAAAQAGIVCFRGLVDTDTTKPSGHGGADVILDNGMLPCYQVINTTTTADLIATLQRTIQRGGSQVFLFHDIVTPADTTIKYTPANFKTFIDNCWRVKEQVSFVGLADFYSALKDPALMQAA